MKRILIRGMTANPGGIESVIMNYYRNLDKSKYSIDFVKYSDTIAYEEEILQTGGRVFKLSNWKKHPFKYQKELKQIFKNTQYDAIWFNCCKMTDLALLSYAKKYGVKTRIIHSHNSNHTGTFLGTMLHKINKMRIKKLANHYWSCSQEASNYFFNKKVQAADNYRIIKNAINVAKFSFDVKTREEYRQNLGWSNNLVIGHVGRLGYQKNQEFLIKIFNEILKKNNQAKLVLIGKGEDEQKLKEMVKEFNIAQCVEFLGVRQDIPQLYSAMDLVVFPSRYEGLPVALVEAQTSGLPIIASDTISPETKLTDHYYVCSLQDDEKCWADFVCKTELNSNREQSAKLLQNSAFDIKTQVKSFEDMLGD